MHIKLKFLLLLITLLVNILPVSAQQAYTIKGHLSNFKSNQFVYLFVSSSNIKDSVLVQNGTFQFKGNLAEPGIAFVATSKLAPQENSDYRILCIQPGNITISGKDSLKTAKIEGAPLTDEFLKLMTIMKEEGNAGSLRYAQEHPDSQVSLYALLNAIADRNLANDIVEAYQNLNATVRSTPTGKQLEASLANLVLVKVGAPALEFTLPDVNNKPVKLADFKGQYVLVDFWASWCAPCRAENPHVVAAYNKYKDKNFTVLGVSLDSEKDRDKWLKAIKADGLLWTQVSDLKGWDSVAAKRYNIVAIPTNFLIDPNGIIVAMNLRGENLEKKLLELLH